MAAHRPSNDSGVRRRPIRLLLVDDEAQTRAPLAFGLRSDGHLLRTARCTIELYDEAMSWGGADVPDAMVVVLRDDAKLEAICGSVATRWCVPIIAVAGSDTAAARDRAARLSAGTMCQNPLNVEDVRSAVRRVVGTLRMYAGATHMGFVARSGAAHGS